MHHTFLHHIKVHVGQESQKTLNALSLFLVLVLGKPVVYFSHFMV